MKTFFALILMMLLSTPGGAQGIYMGRDGRVHPQVIVGADGGVWPVAPTFCTPGFGPCPVILAPPIYPPQPVYVPPPPNYVPPPCPRRGRACRG